MTEPTSNNNSAERTSSGKPLISVITIVFNGEDCLGETIESVLRQDFDRMEFVVIDGGSTDSTVKIIQKHQTSIDHWVSEPDKGISDAFNKGVRKSRGNWLLFLNCGDTLVDGTVLTRISAYLENNANLDVIYGQVNLIRPDRTFIKSYGRPYTVQSMARSMIIPHQAAFHNAAYFAKYGMFDAAFKRAMDYDLLLRNRELKTHYVGFPISNMMAGGMSQVNIPLVFLEYRAAQVKNLQISWLRSTLYYLDNLIKYYLAKTYRRWKGYPDPARRK